MIRLLLYGLGIYAAYKALKSRSAFFPETGGDGPAAADKSPVSEDLIKDPQCGTYFMRQRGVETTIDGKRLYFCSRECRDAYLYAYDHPG